MGDQAEVTRCNLAQNVGIELVGQALQMPQMAIGGMGRPAIALPARREWHIFDGVLLYQAPRHGERRMWTDPRDEEHPRRALIGVLSQPLLCRARDLAIIGLIGRLALPRALGIEIVKRCISSFALRIAAAQQREGSAFALMHLHRKDFFGEAVVIAAPILELTNGRDLVALVAKAMHPGRHTTIIGERIVPIT